MANIFWVEDQSHWIDKFQPVLKDTDFDGQPNSVIVVRFLEAVKQTISSLTEQQSPDLAILDANMNGNSQAGFTASQLLQKKWPGLPIIYLSEHSGTDIEQQALDALTTRDFIAKHQRNIEAVLCWRIKAILRQRNIDDATSADFITSGDLSIDRQTWEVYWRGQKLMNPANPKRPLAPTPRKILRFLVESSPRPLTTGQIVDYLEADPERFSYANYRQHIATLRRAFDLCDGNCGSFQQRCKEGKGIITFGDDGAYCWKPL